MHKDQERVQDKLLPQIMDRILEDSAEARLDCTVLNRALIQGPDPLFLMTALPETFGIVCGTFGLTPEEGREAIDSAHWRGPGILLDGKGWEGRMPGVQIPTGELPPKAHCREALWLFLAGCSDCTESGYTGETTLVERIQRQAKAIAQFDRSTRFESPWASADKARFEFLSMELTLDDSGVPHGDSDECFYVGYKQGYKMVAQDAPGMTFYGTTPDTTLAEQGITPNKEISPSFGIIFHGD